MGFTDEERRQINQYNPSLGNLQGHGGSPYPYPRSSPARFDWGTAYTPCGDRGNSKPSAKGHEINASIRNDKSMFF